MREWRRPGKARHLVAIDAYLTTTTADPKPFVWHASAQSIIEKLARRKAIHEAAH